MPYEIWLSYNNQQEGWQLPVMPGSIEMNDGIKSKTYDISGLGEINVIQDRKLTDYSLGSFFPAIGKRQTPGSDPFITAAVYFEPKKYIDDILRWMGTKQPIRFVFTGDSFDINEAVSIEGFDWKEVAGSGGDIEYTLKLKKYVFYAARKVTVAPSSGTGGGEEIKIQKAPAPRPSDKPTPKTYTLAAGDTLWIVAKKVLGNDARWREIQKLNNIPDAKLKSLAVGMLLKLPT